MPGTRSSLVAAVYVPLLLVMNFKYLPPSSRPRPLNVVMVMIGAVTYASFALCTLWDKLSTLLAG